MYLRRCIPLAALFISVLFLSSCGSGPKTPKKAITIWLVGSEAQARTINGLSRAFTESTGYTVDCQAISWGNAHSKYLTSIAGEVTPDIGTMGLTWGMEFGELGAMLDLRERFPEDVAVLENKNFPGLVESTRIGTKVYGVPFDLSEHIMFYRKDMIPEPPDSWESLMAVLKDLKSRGKGMVIDLGSLDWIGFSPFLWQAGGDYFSKGYDSITLNSSEGAKALGFFGSLYSEGVPKTQVPIEQGMRTGDYPLAISGNWKITSMTLSAPEISGKWGIAMLPKGPSGKRTAFVGGRIMGIFKRSMNAPVAWEFIKFLSSPDIQKKLYQASIETEDSYLPPNMDTWRDLPMDDNFKNVLEMQAKESKGPPPVLGWDSMTRFVNHAIQRVILQKADPAAELDKAVKGMREEFKTV
ncbi:MAG: extracellular solute-binding protein [Candidatus Omnitrophica bacterium]|nr:extracellular solute-binding protein [Candidatus Omnitrophota bacterium]